VGTFPALCAQAEKEADVIIWDGGNNDTPFYKPQPGVLQATHPHILDYSEQANNQGFLCFASGYVLACLSIHVVLTLL